MILVITSKRDSHIGPVASQIHKAGIPWVRLNTEDFANNIEIQLSPTTGIGILYVRDSGKTIDLQQVHSVWYRKPDPVNVSHYSLEPPALDYVEAELNEVLLGLYALLCEAKWINDPFRSRIAHRKLLQLKIAKQVGFATPRTLVTNNPHAALEFGRSLKSGIAVKSLGAISITQELDGGVHQQYGIFTRRITTEELLKVEDKICHMPTLFQEFIEKQFELRITVVGRQVFACRIESRADLPADDYRFDTENVNHTQYDCPELHDKLQAYLNYFGLNFGCFDVLISKTGQPVFLEMNPNGQWLWVENMTGLPISKAIADELCREHPLLL